MDSPSSRQVFRPNPTGPSAATCDWVRDFAVEPFIPRRGLRGGHAQTIASHLFTRRHHLPSPERVFVRIEPDVQVLCVCHWQAERSSALTLIIVHGLEGSSDSQYVVGTADKAWATGWNVVRMNVRNCGGTEKLASTLYHSGMSDDIDRVTRFFIERDQLSSVVLAGFSMGGNQVLKLAGEWGEAHPPQVCGVATISPSMDLGISADAIHSAQHRLHDRPFLVSLRGR